MVALNSKRKQRRDTWEEGNKLELAKDTQAILNAAAIGECQAFKYIQEIDLDQLKGELDDE